MDVMSMAKDRGLPIAPNKTRKSLTLPKALVERIKRWRFRMQIDPESAAYERLLEQALDAAEREEQERRE